MQNALPIVSVHIPKTAGSTFRAILRRLEPGRVYYDYGSQFVIADPGTPSLLGRLERARRRLPSLLGPMPWHRVIHGHFPAARFAQRYPDSPFITWLRHPVDRVVSHYHHLRRHPSRSHTISWTMKTTGMELSDFIEISSMQNLQSRYLAGFPLDRLAFVGLQEHFDAMMPAFFETLGRDPVPFEARNVSPDKSHRSGYSIPQEVEARIRDLNRADEELWHSARDFARARGWLSD